ncbi:MAG TPA: AraC family transcriptional regulator [Gammaproteobacteria bacterium]|nr:AraC family transcriptional regulator [Gammaproteobacteria bacterium]
MSADLLSDVLTMTRLTGALMFRLDITGPWGITAHPTVEKFASLLPPGTTHVIAFHVVLDGECWCRQSDGSRLAVAAGQVVVIPNGDPHEIGDQSDCNPKPLVEWLGGRSVLDLRKANLQTGTGSTVSLLCGFLGCDRRAFEPLFASLPSGFTVALGEQRKSLVQYAINEALDDRPGTASLRVRLAELLFTESLRLHMQSLPDNATGWLAGLRDPHVRQALHAMHETPCRDWSVESLARLSASSRSNLAARFRELLGVPPMHYLTELRMQLAAQRLVGEHESLERVAGEVGYDSSAAFQRAFKRHFGQSPAAWRRQALR